MKEAAATLPRRGRAIFTIMVSTLLCAAWSSAFEFAFPNPRRCSFASSVEIFGISFFFFVLEKISLFGAVFRFFGFRYCFSVFVCLRRDLPRLVLSSFLSYLPLFIPVSFRIFSFSAPRQFRYFAPGNEGP